VNCELDADADRDDENDGRNCAQLDPEKTHGSEELNDDRGNDDDDDGGDPRTHEHEADDEEDGSQDANESHRKPESKAEILFPKCEWNSAGKVRQTSFFKLFAYLSDASDGVNGHLRVSEVVQVKRDPRENDRLRLWNLEVGVSHVVEPFFRGRHEAGLAVAVGHAVVGGPGRQVVIECAWVDDAVRVDQSVSVQESLVDRVIDVAGLNHQFVRENRFGGRVCVPAFFVQVSGGHVVVEGRLKSSKPVPEQRKPELGKSTVVVFDDSRHADEGVVVVVQDLLVLRILEVALSDGVHVVEAEVVVLSLEKPVDGGVSRHDVSQVKSVSHFGQTVDSGSGHGDAENDGQDLDRGPGDPVAVVSSGEPGERPLRANFSELRFAIRTTGLLFYDQIARRGQRLRV